MDGFNQSEAADYGAYTQFLPEDLPNHWHWAEQFVLLDNFFTSAHGPSFPNHLFAIAARSGGAYENPVQDRAQLARRHRETGLFKAWGCDSLSDAFVGVKDAEGNADGVFPCFDLETAGDLLDRKRIPWACYSATPYQNGYLWNAFSAISHVRRNPERWARHCFPVDESRPAHPRGSPAAGDVGNAALRGLRPSGVQLLLGRELDHEGPERDHGELHVEGDGRVPHVG